MKVVRLTGSWPGLIDPMLGVVIKFTDHRPDSRVLIIGPDQKARDMSKLILNRRDIKPAPARIPPNKPEYMSGWHSPDPVLVLCLQEPTTELLDAIRGTFLGKKDMLLILEGRQ